VRWEDEGEGGKIEVGGRGVRWEEGEKERGEGDVPYGKQSSRSGPIMSTCDVIALIKKRMS
jgi:hypothetical protein